MDSLLQTPPRDSFLAPFTVYCHCRCCKAKRYRRRIRRERKKSAEQLKSAEAYKEEQAKRYRRQKGREEDPDTFWEAYRKKHYWSCSGHQKDDDDKEKADSDETDKKTDDSKDDLLELVLAEPLSPQGSFCQCSRCYDLKRDRKIKEGAERAKRVYLFRMRCNCNGCRLYRAGNAFGDVIGEVKCKYIHAERETFLVNREAREMRYGIPE